MCFFRDSKFGCTQFGRLYTVWNRSQPQLRYSVRFLKISCLKRVDYTIFHIIMLGGERLAGGVHSLRNRRSIGPGKNILSDGELSNCFGTSGSDTLPGPPDRGVRPIWRGRGDGGSKTGKIARNRKILVIFWTILDDLVEKFQKLVLKGGYGGSV